jgi:hypothetical protein
METLRPGIREAHRIPHTSHQLPSDLAGTARPPPENLLDPLRRSRAGPKPEKLLPRPGDRASFLRTPKPATSFFTPAVPGEFRIAVISIHASRTKCRNPSIFRFSNAATKLKPGYSKANVLVRRAEALLNPIRLPDAHHCRASCRYWRLIEPATMLLPSI